MSQINASIRTLKDEIAFLKTENQKLLETVQALNNLRAEEIALTKRRLEALAFATGVLDEESVSFQTATEWGEMLKSEHFEPQSVLMSKSFVDLDSQIYEKVVSSGYMTTTDVMKTFDLSRPGAQKAMKRAAEFHDDLIFSKQRIKAASRRSVWILEHVSFRNPSVLVSGIV